MIVKRVLNYGLKSLYFATLLTLVVWALPIFQPRGDNKTSIGVKIRNLTSKPMLWSGLWQGWTMFSPEASRINFRIQIAIEFYDGTFHFASLPLLHKMNSWQAYRHERHRKFAENIQRDSGRKLWPHVADYYQALYAATHGPVKRIDLVRWWTMVPEPDFSTSPPQPPTYMEYEKSYLFYTAKYPNP